MSRVNYVSEKVFNLTVRARQLSNRNKTSYPYISGDSFANTCDVYLYGKAVFSQAEINNAYSIFCPSEKLEEFLACYGDQISAKILVFGNTDRDFFELSCDFPPSVTAVYLQNSHISNDFFHTLPIGIENLRYGRNGQLSLFKRSLAEREKNGKILVGPFSPTHPERFELSRWEDIQHPRLQIISEHLRPKVLASFASNFQFIACPRGNGTDTHRFWEALYRGTIPVVKRSAWSESIREIGFPLIQLDSWNFEEFIVASEEMVSTVIYPRDISQLWMSSWEPKFNLNSK